MRIHLSEHFTYKKLLRFVLPSVATVVFTSIYGVVDVQNMLAMFHLRLKVTTN